MCNLNSLRNKDSLHMFRYYPCNCPHMSLDLLLDRIGLYRPNPHNMLSIIYVVSYYNKAGIKMYTCLNCLVTILRVTVLRHSLCSSDNLQKSLFHNDPGLLYGNQPVQLLCDFRNGDYQVRLPANVP